MASRGRALFGWALAAYVAAGCAAAHKAPAEPSGSDASSMDSPQDEEQDPEALETQLLDQEGVIVRELLPPASPEPGGATALGEAAASPAPRASPAACGTACKALASMRRAAEGICRLTEGEPDRCERARQRVGRASARVANAGCVCEPED